ncbi:hypothetical protein MMC30_003243 [Trapelia coarctata]|nr:hypothetical protein [Trapelia coarctata]
MDDSQDKPTGVKQPRGESTAEQLDSTENTGFEQVFTLLKSKNDTKRFVGSTLLMKMLEGIKDDKALLHKCWEAIPSTFLTGLLRAKVLARTGESRNPEEAQAKFQLGLDILHTFVSLLSEESLMPFRMDEIMQTAWKRRLDALLEEVPESAETTKAEILQVLLTVASTSMGARLLYQTLAGHDWTPLIKETPTEPLAIRILFMIFHTLDGLHPNLKRTLTKDMTEQLDVMLCRMLKQIRPTAPSAKNSVDGLYELFQAIRYRSPFDDTHKCSDGNMVKWMEALAKMMGTAVKDRRSLSSGIQESVVHLARFLVERIPQFKVILFDSSLEPASRGGTPLSFTFITTLLIDIRSTIPSIPEIHDKPGYLETSTRLANSYDLAFLYLDSLLEAEDPDDDNRQDASGDPPARLPYKLLLKLQEDITQTMHLTVESLRDRYDTAAKDDTKLLQMAADTLVVSQIGALGFWLHDEDTASADDLLEVLLRLCLCETPYRRLYAKTVEVMVRDRQDLQQRAKALVEDENGLGKSGRRGGGDFFRVEEVADPLAGLGARSAESDGEDEGEVMWGGDLTMNQDWMPGDVPYVPDPRGRRMPKGWNPEDDTEYAL